MGVHHWRRRVHGPGFPLAVAYCARHRRAFTIYPPGWVPYGRATVAPAQLDGGRAQGWPQTVFDTALAVANGQRWDWNLREGQDVQRLSYSTEYAHVDRCSRLLGVHADLGLDLRHDIGEVLGVPATVLLGLAGGLERPLYVSCSKAIVDVIKALPSPPDWQAVMVTGHLAGLWPAPLWSRKGHLVPLAFRAVRTPPSAASEAAPNRSTTSARERPRAPP